MAEELNWTARYDKTVELEAKLAKATALFNSVKEKENREHPDLLEEVQEIEKKLVEERWQQEMISFIKSTELYKDLEARGFILSFTKHGVVANHPSIIKNLEF